MAPDLQRRGDSRTFPIRELYANVLLEIYASLNKVAVIEDIWRNKTLKRLGDFLTMMGCDWFKPIRLQPRLYPRYDQDGH